jgi:hypothetical protein
MTKTFNPDEAYGTVSGIPGVKYIQAGEYFSPRYEWVPEEKALSTEPLIRRGSDKREEERLLVEKLKEERRAAWNANPPRAQQVSEDAKPDRGALDMPAFLASPAAAFAQVKVTEEPKLEVESLESLHWSKLRKMVQAAGGEYEGKEQAIAWLRENTQ